MPLKLAKDWRFWGIDINVFMGDLSTLSLSLVLEAAPIGSILIEFESK